MTALPLEPHTEAEEARLARFEGAEPAEESAVSRVAEALLITILGTDDRDILTGCDLPADEIARLIVEHGAAAAIGAMKGPSPAEEALARVEALAETWEKWPARLRSTLAPQFEGGEQES